MHGPRRLGLGLLAPLVFLPDLRFLLRREIVDDAERFADVLRRLALDHGSNASARQVKQRIDVHVVRSQDELEKCLLFHLNIVCIALLYDLVHA